MCADCVVRGIDGGELIFVNVWVGKIRMVWYNGLKNVDVWSFFND